MGDMRTTFDSCVSFDDCDERIAHQLMPGNYETEYMTVDLDQVSFSSEKLPASSFASIKDAASKSKEKNSEPRNRSAAEKLYAQYTTKEYQDKIVAEFGDSAIFI